MNEGNTERKPMLVKTGGKIENCVPIWNLLTDKHGLSYNQMGLIRIANIPARVQGKPGTLVRVFSPAQCQAKGIDVKSFNSLDGHLELVLYEGYYCGTGEGGNDPGETVIEKKTGTGPSLLDQKLQDGSITDVGLKEPDKNDPCPCGSGQKYKKCHGK